MPLIPVACPSQAALALSDDRDSRRVTAACPGPGSGGLFKLNRSRWHWQARVPYYYPGSESYAAKTLRRGRPPGAGAAHCQTPADPPPAGPPGRRVRPRNLNSPNWPGVARMIPVTDTLAFCLCLRGGGDPHMRRGREGDARASGEWSAAGSSAPPLGPAPPRPAPPRPLAALPAYTPAGRRRLRVGRVGAYGRVAWFGALRETRRRATRRRATRRPRAPRSRQPRAQLDSKRPGQLDGRCAPAAGGGMRIARLKCDPSMHSSGWLPVEGGKGSQYPPPPWPWPPADCCGRRDAEDLVRLNGAESSSRFRLTWHNMAL